MEIERLIRFAEAYSGLGWAIQRQLDDVMNGDFSDLNENAVSEMFQKLNGFNDELDCQIQSALQSIRD